MRRPCGSEQHTKKQEKEVSLKAETAGEGALLTRNAVGGGGNDRVFLPAGLCAVGEAKAREEHNHGAHAATSDRLAAAAIAVAICAHADGGDRSTGR